MSELKEYTADDIQELDDKRLEESESGKIDCTRVYLKSEADKVIAEKDAEIAALRKAQSLRKFPEEKPEWGKEVLVIDDAGDFHIVRFSHDFKWVSWGKMNTCESNCVLYWMPLPEKPKDDKFKEAK